MDGLFWVAHALVNIITDGLVGEQGLAHVDGPRQAAAGAQIDDRARVPGIDAILRCGRCGNFSPTTVQKNDRMSGYL